MRLIKMKELLSYWDISLGLISIGFGIYIIYSKERDDYLKRKANGRWKISYSRYMENRFEHLICNILIVFGILFIYNRLRNNLPNIVIFLKEFSTY